MIDEEYEGTAEESDGFSDEEFGIGGLDIDIDEFDIDSELGTGAKVVGTVEQAVDEKGNKLRNAVGHDSSYRPNEEVGERVKQVLWGIPECFLLIIRGTAQFPTGFLNTVKLFESVPKLKDEDGVERGTDFEAAAEMLPLYLYRANDFLIGMESDIKKLDLRATVERLAVRVNNPSVLEMYINRIKEGQDLLQLIDIITGVYNRDYSNEFIQRIGEDESKKAVVKAVPLLFKRVEPLDVLLNRLNDDQIIYLKGKFELAKHTDISFRYFVDKSIKEYFQIKLNLDYQH